MFPSAFKMLFYFQQMNTDIESNGTEYAKGLICSYTAAAASVESLLKGRAQQGGRRGRNVSKKVFSDEDF